MVLDKAQKLKLKTLAESLARKRVGSKAWESAVVEYMVALPTGVLLKGAMGIRSDGPKAIQKLVEDAEEVSAA